MTIEVKIVFDSGHEFINKRIIPEKALKLAHNKGHILEYELAEAGNAVLTLAQAFARTL